MRHISETSPRSASLLEDVQGVDPTSYLNISSFSNVEAAKHVVDLAKNTQKLQEMQQTPTFLSPTSRQDNINKVRELTCKEDYINNNNITVDLGYRLINPSALPVLEELLCIDDKNVNYTYNKPSSDRIFNWIQLPRSALCDLLLAPPAVLVEIWFVTSSLDQQCQLIDHHARPTT